MHPPISRFVPLFLLASPLTVSPVGASEVITVDDDGSPASSDFASIGEAIDAAEEGDLILVRGGLYPGWTLDGKGLFVVAEAGADVRIEGEMRVRNVPGGSRALVFGIRTADETHSEVLGVESCSGAVWFQDCRFQGADSTFLEGGNAVTVRNCESVVFEGCTLASFVPSSPEPQNPGNGLFAHDSGVFLFGCDVRGGAGGADLGSEETAPAGHAAARIDGGFFFAQNSRMSGGAGADGFDSPFIGCSDAGAGGPGLLLEGSSPDAVIWNVELAGGLGGTSASPACSDGANGGESQIDAGQVSVVARPAAQMWTGPPVLAGTSTSLTVTGTPESMAWIVMSATPAPFAGLRDFGALLLEIPLLPLFLGTVDEAGGLDSPYDVPEFQNPTRAFAAVWCQVLTMESDGALVLGNGRVLVHLAEKE